MPKKIKIPILIILLIGIGISIFNLFQYQLWEYSTLFFFLFSWLFIVGLTENKFSKLPLKNQYIGFSFLSGILLWAGFPSLGLSPLLLIAWIPLFWIERKISNHFEGINKMEMFKFSFNTAMLWNILSTYWVGNSSLFAGVFAITANSLLMTIPWVLFHVVKNRMPNLSYFSFISFWITFEFFHFRWDLAWPWLTLGNGFSAFHSWIQWYEFTGVLGGSFWILMSNILLFKLIEKIIVGEPLKKHIFKSNAFILLPIIFSL